MAWVGVAVAASGVVVGGGGVAVAASWSKAQPAPCVSCSGCAGGEDLPSEICRGEDLPSELSSTSPPELAISPPEIAPPSGVHSCAAAPSIEAAPSAAWLGLG